MTALDAASIVLIAIPVIAGLAFTGSVLIGMWREGDHRMAAFFGGLLAYVIAAGAVLILRSTR